MDRDTEYLCKYCGVKCDGAIFLERHYNTHSDIFPFDCNQCEKRFPTQKQLNCHLPHCRKYNEYLKRAIGEAKEQSDSLELDSDDSVSDSKMKISISIDDSYDRDDPKDLNVVVSDLIKEISDKSDVDLDDTQCEVTPKNPLKPTASLKNFIPEVPRSKYLHNFTSILTDEYSQYYDKIPRF